MFKFLRWLLLPLLPLLGLFIGIWLMPERKARWEVAFATQVETLGFIDRGDTLLLIETKEDTAKQTITANGLIGVNAQTGEGRFYTLLSDELLKKGLPFHNSSLVTGDEGILFCHRVEVEPVEETYDELFVYDWKSRKIKKQYRSNCRNGAIAFNKPVMKGTTLAALGGGEHINNLVLWSGDEETPVVLPLSKAIFDFGLSPDGSIVHVCAAYAKSYQLILIDAKQKKQIQTIEGHFREVRWARDLQSFQAVEYDPTQRVHFIQRYQQVEKQYKPDPASKIVIAQAEDIISRGKTHLTMISASHSDPLRRKIVSWLGDSSKFIVDRLWPEGNVLQLHDEQTGRLKDQLILPHTERGNPFVHPKGHSVAMCDTHTVSLWEFRSATRWYPVYGFLAGLLCAFVLVWRQFRQSRRPSPT